MSTSTRLTSCPGGLSACGRITTLLAALVLLAALPAPGQEHCACLVVYNGTHVIGTGQHETHDCMTIESDGVLIIRGTLTLTGQCVSAVTGEVRLKGSAAKLEFTNHHTVTGTGQIRGYHADAEITIASGKTLTNTTDITGKLEITGEGNFTNLGTVEADTNGVLLVNISGALADSAGNDNGWQATAASALLQFGNSLDDNNSSISLSGDFIVSNATAEIQIDEMTGLTSPFTTTGGLTISAGTFDAQESDTMGQDSPADPEEHLNQTGGDIVVAAGMTFFHN